MVSTRVMCLGSVNNAVKLTSHQLQLRINMLGL